MSWFKGLTVRGRALAVGLLLTSVLVAAGSAVKIPFVALGPGATINTLGTWEGKEVFTFSGTGVPESVNEDTGDSSHLNLTTVSVTDGMTLFGALGLWASGSYALVPREEQFPPDKTAEEVRQQNAKQFRDSQSMSEIAALRYLGYPEVTFVGSIPEGSPSLAVLDPQDLIIAVNGSEVSTVASLRAVLSDTRPGDTATVTVRRTAADGTVRELDAEVTLAANPEIGDYGTLGINAAQRPQSTFTISNALAQSKIGGPSAGLMFTLGLIDRLTPGDLPGGKFIAGTGTIDAAGAVGPIGGVVLKLETAREAGAEFFLVPAANCPEALTEVPDGLTLVSVGTLQDAAAAVENIAAGRPAPSC